MKQYLDDMWYFRLHAMLKALFQNMTVICHYLKIKINKSVSLMLY